MGRPFSTVERNHIAHGLHSGFNMASIQNNSLLHKQHVLSVWLFAYLVIIAWKWRCLPGCFSPEPRLQSLDKAVLCSKTSVCIYQYVQVDGGVKHKSLNAVYNSSRYCHCVEEPLMQNTSQLLASCSKMHMNASKYKVKVAPLLRNNFRHLVTAQINKAGWCNWLELDRVFEQPVQADRNNWNWPFLVHQMLSMRPGYELASRDMMMLWIFVELCWIFSCLKTSNPRRCELQNTYKLKHARLTVDYVHYFATPSTGYEMIPPRHEKLWTASLRRKSGRCPTQKCPWHQTIAMQQTCEWWSCHQMRRSNRHTVSNDAQIDKSYCWIVLLSKFYICKTAFCLPIPLLYISWIVQFLILYPVLLQPRFASKHSMSRIGKIDGEGLRKGILCTSPYMSCPDVGAQIFRAVSRPTVFISWIWTTGQNSLTPVADRPARSSHRKGWSTSGWCSGCRDNAAFSISAVPISRSLLRVVMVVIGSATDSKLMSEWFDFQSI